MTLEPCSGFFYIYIIARKSDYENAIKYLYLICSTFTKNKLKITDFSLILPSYISCYFQNLMIYSVCYSYYINLLDFLLYR